MHPTTFGEELPVTCDPNVMGGEPVFQGTRIPARLLFDHLAEGATLDQFLDQFPALNRDHARLLLAHAANSLPRARSRPAMERWGNLKEMDRAFDIEYWRRQDASARIAAVWDLTVAAYALKGEDVHALRLARHLESLQPV
ncbi:MAG: DUF433 domain-containing protein [Blastocatellia bacterium]|nr:DUF433 domain-containing protein [Blastocatellia bacterium]